MSLLSKGKGRKTRTAAGFTLIELLVVVSIIGLLSSVVLTSLNSARTKAKEAALKTQALEFRKLLALEYSENGSYANLTKGWVGGGTASGQTTCEARGYGGAHADQAEGICNSLRSILGLSYDSAFITYGDGNSYSIMVRYPNGTMFCSGSSGATSDKVPYTTPGLSYPGCIYNR